MARYFSKKLFSNNFHYIATQNSCQWHFHRRVAWHVAGHKEVGFVWQELQLKPKIWLHTSYLSPALLQCLQRSQKLYISVIEFQWILAHFVEHECKFCCDSCAFCLQKIRRKSLKNHLKNQCEKRPLSYRSTNNNPTDTVSKRYENGKVINFDTTDKVVGDDYRDWKKCPFCLKIFSHNSFKIHEAW